MGKGRQTKLMHQRSELTSQSIVPYVTSLWKSPTSICTLTFSAAEHQATMVGEKASEHRACGRVARGTRHWTVIPWLLRALLLLGDLGQQRARATATEVACSVNDRRLPILSQTSANGSTLSRQALRE